MVSPSPPLLSRLRRRQLLLGAGAALLPGLLAACGGGKRRSAPSGERRLVIANWPLYIDPSRPGSQAAWRVLSRPAASR